MNTSQQLINNGFTTSQIIHYNSISDSISFKSLILLVLTIN